MWSLLNAILQFFVIGAGVRRDRKEGRQDLAPWGYSFGFAATAWALLMLPVFIFKIPSTKAAVGMCIAGALDVVYLIFFIRFMQRRNRAR